ncbi:MAG: hydroxyacylglutathione hydrolase [marine bacterium B5-7]|nr:MAG: hydroxyacylglutathione hydrolase [marine bacterium B5-7]
MTAHLEVHQFPVLNDNYAFLVHDAAQGITASIDTPDARAILSEAERLGWTITHIFNTHHHHDHAGGNLAIKEASGCTIYGNSADASRIPGIDIKLADGDTFDFGGHVVEVVETPGHTVGHIVYYIADESIAFVGDTLFAMGCGRLFEGSPQQMWNSLSRIRQWPDDTRIYCAHEYTLANAEFAMSVEPDNTALRQRFDEVKAMRRNHKPTVPTTLAIERQTNPFLRADVPEFINAIDMPGQGAVDVFAETRRRKDSF